MVAAAVPMLALRLLGGLAAAAASDGGGGGGGGRLGGTCGLLAIVVVFGAP